MSEYLFTSESVSEGHPDKVADQVSDAILDAILAQDPKARVAAETLVNTGLWVFAGGGSVTGIRLVRIGRRNYYHRPSGLHQSRTRNHQTHRLQLLRAGL